MSLEAPRHAANAGPRRTKMRLERDDRGCGGLGLWRWWCAESSVPRRRGRQSAWLRAKGLCPESRRSATPPLRLYYASATPPLAGSCGALSRLLSLGRPWGAVPFGGGGGASTTTVNEGQALHITWHFHSSQQADRSGQVSTMSKVDSHRAILLATTGHRPRIILTRYHLGFSGRRHQAAPPSRCPALSRAAAAAAAQAAGSSADRPRRCWHAGC